MCFHLPCWHNSCKRKIGKSLNALHSFFYLVANCRMDQCMVLVALSYIDTISRSRLMSVTASERLSIAKWSDG